MLRRCPASSTPSKEQFENPGNPRKCRRKIHLHRRPNRRKRASRSCFEGMFLAGRHHKHLSGPRVASDRTYQNDGPLFPESTRTECPSSVLFSLSPDHRSGQIYLVERSICTYSANGGAKNEPGIPAEVASGFLDFPAIPWSYPLPLQLLFPSTFPRPITEEKLRAFVAAADPSLALIEAVGKVAAGGWKFVSVPAANSLNASRNPHVRGG